VVKLKVELFKDFLKGGKYDPMKKKSLSLLITSILILNLFIVGNALAGQTIEKSSTPQKTEKPIKYLDNQGKIPSKWNLQKPEPKPHPDTPPPVEGNKDYKAPDNTNNIVTMSGSGDGINNISFSQFESGDIIVVLGTATGHAGEFDFSRYYYNLTDYCIWSANVEPVNGVQLEQPAKYRNYDEAYGLWVPSVSYSNRVGASNYCAAQNGEPYQLNAYKYDTTMWYCSKLAWGSYYVTVGVDLDADGGYYVWPVDLINDSQTSLFEYST